MDDDDTSLVDVTQTVTSEALILRVSGEIDLSITRAAEDRLRAAVATLPPPFLVVVDLTAVDILSAAGLRLLDHLVTACADKGLGVHIVAGPASVPRRVMRIVGLDKTIPTFDDLDQALRTN